MVAGSEVPADSVEEIDLVVEANRRRLCFTESCDVVMFISARWRVASQLIMG